MGKHPCRIIFFDIVTSILGRETTKMTVGGDMVSQFHRLQWACLLLLLILLAGCSLKQTLKKPEGEREFLQETTRLEKLAHEHPEASVRAQSHLQLAFLYVNERNPQLDYTRALQEMESYLFLEPSQTRSDDVQNWLAVLREMDRLRKDQHKLREKNGDLQTQVDKLLTSLGKEQEANKSLRDEVTNLKGANSRMKEAIEKLKSLDRQMEEKRRRIK
jgi:dynactin complex subunit